MVNNLIPGNRLNNLRSITRHCSFCGQRGHNIRNCNNEEIINFGNECQIKKHLCDLTADSKNNFKDWLINYYLRPNGGEVIRAYAVSKCNCTLRSSIDTIIEKIIDKMYPADYIEEIIPVNQNETMTAVRFLRFLRYYSPVVPEELKQCFNITGTVVLLDENKSEEICDCAICYEEEMQVKNFVTLNCQHKFCKDCLKNSFKSVQRVPTCALCRSEITTIIVHNDNIKDEFKELMN